MRKRVRRRAGGGGQDPARPHAQGPARGRKTSRRRQEGRPVVGPAVCAAARSTVTYSLMGALVGPGSGSMQRGGMPRLHERHKKWGRAHGRAKDVAACECFREEEAARVAGLGMAPEEAAGLEVAPEEDH